MVYQEALDQHILKFRAKGKKCPLCLSTNVGVNPAKTILCFGCHYHTTGRRRMWRGENHPLFKELGRKIKKVHPDFSRVPKDFWH